MRLKIGLLLAAVSGFSAAVPEPPLPLFFFPNTGQTDSSVQYIVQTPDLSARFRPSSAIFQAHRQQVGVRFVGANPGVSIGGLDPLAAKVNFFLGSSGWKTDVPSFSKIVYRELYRGIDMTYGGTGRQVKSEFVVAPGANSALIRLEYSEPVSIDAQGNLLVGADFRETSPEIYQQTGAFRVKVTGRYRVLDAHTIGFEIGAYDDSKPLIIDPTISYCTYLGGIRATAITGVAVDSSANLYVTGWTSALNFPINGAVQAANQGGDDAIVAKLNPAGTALLYATYIGGLANDQGNAIAVDSLGQAYVTGVTSSSNFPLVLSNRGGLGGTTTAFALKLNATGNTLLYSGYLGGTIYDIGSAIAVDANFNAYISGTTLSSNFPTLSPTQASLAGGTDVFVTKLNSAGTITFSTYLGGSGNEQAGGIAVDSLGNIFIAGGTSSANFPVVSPLQSTLAGTQDAFVTKISFANTIAFSTHLGGTGGSTQQASAIALDSAGNPYITGVTTSGNFPVTSGAFQTILNGLENAFVAKLTSTGQTLVYSTYLGGSSFDWGYGIAVSPAGNAYVAGNTSSVDFPQANAVQAAFNGVYDAFVTELNFGGTTLLFSTYYGGSGSDAANAIALDSNANMFIGGQTSSLNLTLVTPIQSTNNASSSGWVLRLGVTALPTTTPSVLSVSPPSGSAAAVTFTAQFSDTGGGAALTTAALLVNTSSSISGGCYVNYNPASNLLSIYNDAGTAVLSTLTPGSGSAQNDQCGLNGVGSSVNVSGTTLTVAFSVTFLTAFSGAKNVYLQAGDTDANTGWIAEGTYTATILPGTPQVISVAPNANGGFAQIFTLVYGDTVAASNISAAVVLFNASLSASNACDVGFSFPANTVGLLSDSGLSSTSMAIGSSGSLQNGQCFIQATTATLSGFSLTISVAIAFKGPFNGAKNIYMNSSTPSSSSGYIQMGTYAAVGLSLISPVNAAQGVSLNPTLSWAAAVGATSYDVYFGTSPPPQVVTNTTATSYAPATLSSNTTYYWQVVAKNAAAATSSAIFSFDTVCTFAAAPAGVLIGYAGGPASVSVTAGTGCGWTATSNASWVTITAGGSGSGNGSISFTATSNAGIAQLAYISFANQRVGVMQSGSPTVQIFNDILPSDPFFDYVSLMSSNGITAGCQASPPLYCPNTPVTRAQMAVFVMRGLEIATGAALSYPPIAYFQDVPTSGVPDSIYFPYVQAIAQLGITAGCQTSPPLYCPDDSITQGQMAVFMIVGWMLANNFTTFTYPTTPSSSPTFSPPIHFSSLYKRWRNWDSGRVAAGVRIARAVPLRGIRWPR